MGLKTSFSRLPHWFHPCRLLQTASTGRQSDLVKALSLSSPLHTQCLLRIDLSCVASTCPTPQAFTRAVYPSGNKDPLPDSYWVPAPTGSTLLECSLELSSATFARQQPRDGLHPSLLHAWRGLGGWISLTSSTKAAGLGFFFFLRRLFYLAHLNPLASSFGQASPEAGGLFPPHTKGSSDSPKA